MSNRKMFRYEWIWRKNIGAGFLQAHKMPLRVHENILVFYKKLPTYNPQKVKAKKIHASSRKRNKDKVRCYTIRGLKSETYEYKDDGWRFPVDVQKFDTPNTKRKCYHPTQKPVDLLEYLIKTYTNEGELVLDNCIGSGSTAVAAINTNRNFLGFETDSNYCEIANKRIEDAYSARKMRLIL